jgi:hypothetical protein
VSNSCGWVAAYTAAMLYDSKDNWWNADLQVPLPAWRKIIQQGNTFLGLPKAGTSTRFLTGDECLMLCNLYSTLHTEAVKNSPDDDCYVNGPSTIAWFQTTLQKWMDRTFNENPQDVNHASKMFMKLYFHTSIFILNTDSTGDGVHWFTVALKLNPDYY